MKYRLLCPFNPSYIQAFSKPSAHAFMGHFSDWIKLVALFKQIASLNGCIAFEIYVRWPLLSHGQLICDQLASNQALPRFYISALTQIIACESGGGKWHSQTAKGRKNSDH